MPGSRIDGPSTAHLSVPDRPVERLVSSLTVNSVLAQLLDRRARQGPLTAAEAERIADLIVGDVGRMALTLPALDAAPGRAAG